MGRNLAATPGKVVYRNELMELIQYEPQTEQVHAGPLLCSPPWINKYYVMDLAPGRSFIEWAVQHGRTVFAISYRNPTADMCGTTHGRLPDPRPADRARRHRGDHRRRDDRHRRAVPRRRADRDHRGLPGAGGDSRVGTLTLLNTMLDYAEPGALGRSPTRGRWDGSSRRCAGRARSRATSMAGTFDVLRANDLIFNYVVSNWLMGQKPPAFDILAWNADSTRMPAAMHAFYLRNFYVAEQARARAAGDRRAHDRPGRDQVADLHRQRDQRPHRAVGGGLQDGRPGQRAGPVRAGQRRPHRRHRQSADAKGVVRDRLEPAVDAASLARRRLAQRRLLVGGLDGLVHGPRRGHGRPARGRK